MKIIGGGRAKEDLNLNVLYNFLKRNFGSAVSFEPHTFLLFLSTFYKKTEVQRGQLTCIRPRSSQVGAGIPCQA